MRSPHRLGSVRATGDSRWMSLLAAGLNGSPNQKPRDRQRLESSVQTSRFTHEVGIRGRVNKFRRCERVK